MIKLTAAQQTAVETGRYKHFVRFTLEGSTLTLGENEIWEKGFQVDQAVSGQSSFELGACVVNQLKVDIYNPSGQYQNTDFLGKPVYAYIELYNEDMTTVIGEVSKGHYIVDEADTNGGVIHLTCLDMMTMLDTPYSEVTTVYPATLYNIVNDIATKFGLTLSLDGASWLPTGISSNYTVTNRPTEDVTCRDVLSAVCQATGNYATIDRLGRLLITRYDTDFISETGSDYSTYEYHDVTPSELFSLSRDEAQVVLTGVSVEVGETAYTAGTDEYMIHVKDNSMINAGEEQTFATALNGVINGWNFRPFDAKCLTNMCMEAGDNILLTDTLGNIYKSVVTHMEYFAGQNQRVECNAESAVVNASTRYSQAARSAAKAVKNYDSTVNNYIDLVSKGLGMYRSLITDPDDPTSQIYAFHNEETLANSTFCMFENANGIQVGRRDTTSDPWTYTSASVEDAVVLAQTLVANTAIIDALFSNDVTVTGALHSDDYIPAATGASPPYSQQGMGLDFGEKEFEAENFAVDANGNLFAKGATFEDIDVTGGRITLNDDGGAINPNLRIYKENSEDYGTTIGSVSWSKEWYDPNDTARFYYYAWEFDKGEMSGHVADDAMRLRINWQKGTIETTGNVTAGWDLYVGNDLSVDGNIENYGVPTPLTANPTGGTANDTRAFWVNKGACYCVISATNQLHGQPSQYGIVESRVIGNEVFQLWHTQPNGDIYVRGANTSTTAMPSWKPLQNYIHNSGNWTPTCPRANITASSGKWFQNGGMVLLYGEFTFSSSQTNKGSLFIDLASLPSIARNGKGIIGMGMAEVMFSFSGNADINDNVFFTHIGAASTVATDSAVVGKRLRFYLHCMNW